MPTSTELVNGTVGGDDYIAGGAGVRVTVTLGIAACDEARPCDFDDQPHPPGPIHVVLHDVATRHE